MYENPLHETVECKSSVAAEQWVAGSTTSGRGGGGRDEEADGNNEEALQCKKTPQKTRETTVQNATLSEA